MKIFTSISSDVKKLEHLVTLSTDNRQLRLLIRKVVCFFLSHKIYLMTKSIFHLKISQFFLNGEIEKNKSNSKVVFN